MKNRLPAALAILFLFISAHNTAAAGDPCLACHEQKTPGLVRYWKNSVHAGKNIGCAGCHGTDIEANHKRERVVDASVCGTCHAKALASHRTGKHGTGFRTGRACTRNSKKTREQEKTCALCHAPGSAVPLVKTECALFLAQTPEMQQQGCNSCHRIENQCDTCHTKHGTDLDLARDPNTCGTCHMGPDHPQLEMWETSQHGAIYKRSGASAAPACAACHMPQGSHNVSDNISSGQPGNAPEGRNQRRALMVELCGSCHTKAFAARNLAEADAIERQSNALVAEAQEIIEGLQNEGLLLPAPAERPPHPIFGSSFVLGPQMLYENLSSIESTFFKMNKFYAISAYKGAFHQNPDYAHWYGNAPLKLALSEIKSQALLLRQIAALKKRVDNLGASAGNSEKDALRKELRLLEEQRLTNKLTVPEYEAKKKKLLDESGL